MASNLETDIEMQSLISNNDDSLHKFYEEKCLFSIPKDEVTLIQHAVEFMVRFLLLTIYENTSFSELIVSGKSIMRTLESFKTPPNIPYAFDDNNLLKVGSFYENTKNCYPDEFDFIYVFAECRENEFVIMKELLSTMADIFHDCLKKAVVKPFLAETCIEFVGYVRKHGPAAKLEFRYESVNARGNKKSIFVDISPALKVFTQNNFSSKMFDIDLHPDWKKRVQATGSFLLLKFFSAGHPKRKTNIKISIAESEHQYISEEMSEKHKQVYRLLKYLLSNGAEEEKLRKLIRGRHNLRVIKFMLLRSEVVYDFSSYVIKTSMFHHCLCCNNSSETISDCVLSVVNFILNLFKSEQSKRVKSQSFRQGITFFPVSVKTMTGEMIEIADDYNSSLTIMEYLKEIRDDISKIQLTEQITLAEKMVPVVQKHMMKKKINCRNLSLFHVIIYAILVIGCVSSVIYTVLNTDSKVAEHGVQMHLCWNGTDYMNYTSSVFSNTSNLNMFDMSTVDQGKTPSVISTGNMHCIEYNNILSQENQANMTMANVSRIYYCGDTRSCNTEDNNTEDNIYQLKVFSRGIEQQLVCSALDIESMMENDYLLSDIINNENGRHLACLQTDSACLNIQKRRFGVGLFVNEKAVGCNKHQPCMPTLSKEIMHLCCYMSQHVNESNKATETEICCCDTHACTDPEKGNRENSNNIIAGIVGCSLICIAMTSYYTMIFGVLFVYITTVNGYHRCH
ncbi:uncharacterized protein LOC123544851 isoform X2 [Mercenaria mercenaria]|uniref:uncharacterized protein LOC123544851 isoform X2 n=1 Tax=Mercenaria mercenaria TaxID=6596 RepID=UPI00234EA073|nr:uncharacterized protein LOC123544851 isoform X2 [Mercenaria mercenaria]